MVKTKVLFQGLTNPSSIVGELINLWLQADTRLEFCVCNALLLEYEAVFVRQLAPQRWQVIEPLLIDLLDQATEINIAFSWRPRSPDVGDEHIIDCTMNAQAIVITYNRRDFR